MTFGIIVAQTNIAHDYFLGIATKDLFRKSTERFSRTYSQGADLHAVLRGHFNK